MTTAVERRLGELAERYALPPDAPDQLARILARVAEDPTAPTTVQDPLRAADVHVADSLTGLEVPALRTAGRIADLGAGAGFPGLVLAAARPDAHVFLIESLGRKCAFLERAIADAGLTNAEVVCSRAEEWREGTGSIDVVTARAVAPLAVLVEYAAPLLRLGGTLVAYKGVRDADEEQGGDAAAGATGLERAGATPVAPYDGAEHRTLYAYSKVIETPRRFPRRAGMARKRPLSG